MLLINTMTGMYYQLKLLNNDLQINNVVFAVNHSLC